MAFDILPPLPPWDGLHPLVVHFPIALLMVSPLFVLLAGLLGSYGRGFALTAMLLLVLGTAGASLAVATGQAALERTPELSAAAGTVLVEHQEWGGKTRTVFLALCVLYSVILLVPVFLRKLNRIGYVLPTHMGFLALLLVALAMLVSVADSGHRLVHQYGARARAVADEPPPQAVTGEPLAPPDEQTPSEEPSPTEAPPADSGEPAGPAAEPSPPAAQPPEEPAPPEDAAPPEEPAPPEEAAPSEEPAPSEDAGAAADAEPAAEAEPAEDAVIPSPSDRSPTDAQVPEESSAEES